MPNTGISGCAKRAITEQDGTVRPIEVRHDGDAGACLAGVRCCGRYDLNLWIGHLFEGAAYLPR